MKIVDIFVFYLELLPDLSGFMPSLNKNWQ